MGMIQKTCFGGGILLKFQVTVIRSSLGLGVLGGSHMLLSTEQFLCKQLLYQQENQLGFGRLTVGIIRPRL
jgi:hypothetical protein